MADLPTLPRLRIIAAIGILAFWIILTTVDAFVAQYRIDPFVNIACGAVTAWLFGSGLKGGSS